MRKGDERGVLELAVKRGVEKALEQVRIEAEKDKDDSLKKQYLIFTTMGFI
jgi:hypothetical protein